MAKRHEPRHWLAREDTTGRVLRLPDRTEADPRLDADTITGFYTRRIRMRCGCARH